MEPRNFLSTRAGELTGASGGESAPALNEAEVRRRLATHAPVAAHSGTADPVPAAGSGRRGDDDLNPGFLTPLREVKPAAVLIPLVRRADDLTVLLTRRASHLPNHAGQICFPGGRIEHDDESASHAALREADEEVGLEPDRIALAAQLDPYLTRTGYAVTPLVGLLDPPAAFRPEPTEVAEIFEVPLAFILDPAKRETHSITVRGTARRYHVFVHGPHYIWGATAGMLVNLAEVLRRPC